ncbi:unnamed protein product [Vicia faba]|uniref:ATP-dependent RNA helicase n=1 Tax=Vicia faba TaxID=3906 RepID=A0AAV1B6G3_VICFA|nr:unnamed protein product [Vicia faba]
MLNSFDSCIKTASSGVFEGITVNLGLWDTAGTELILLVCATDGHDDVKPFAKCLSEIKRTICYAPELWLSRNVENNQFSGSIPPKLLSIPNFRPVNSKDVQFCNYEKHSGIRLIFLHNFCSTANHKSNLLYAASIYTARQYTYTCNLRMNDLMAGDANEFYTISDEVCESFDGMGLQENLLRGIYAYGFEKPSAIQQRGIVPFCKGHDVIQQAQSGTGKTATFCSGVLQQLDYNVTQCQALVLAPTRELAQQIEKVMRALGDYLGVKVHACVGGTSVREDQRILSSGVHVVVGTPGRVFDMLRRQSLHPDYIKMFVLDEADEMLSRVQECRSARSFPVILWNGLISKNWSLYVGCVTM